MGLILGKISVETPKYELILQSPDYEIRIYPPSLLAEITYDPSLLGGRDGGFTFLANYIGAIGEPQNSNLSKIPMTAPVITGGGSNAVTMQFLLPAKYASKEDAPRPTDERVRVREEGERKYGVVKFSGVATEKTVVDRVEKLRKELERDGYKVIGEYVLARYNPPWTLPFLRTNEVMLPIE